MPYSDKNVNDFLRTFLASIKEELPGNSFRFSDFEAAYNKSKIAITKVDQYAINENEDLSWIEDFRIALFHICRVINDPRFTITSYKEALNIEKIVKIDSQDVMDSSKTDRHWDRRPDGQIFPKKFSTSINERDVCIYENRFVVFVVDLMLGFVNQNIFRLRKNIRFMSRNFADEIFSFKDVNNVVDLANFKQFTYPKSKKAPAITYVPLLTSNKSDIIKNLTTLEFFRKELIRITFTQFYNVVKKSGTITYERVIATNLLMGDHDYSSIYDFYLKFLSIRTGPSYKAPIYRPWYYDFVAISLLMTFKDLGYSFNQNRIMFDEVHHLVLKNYNVEKDGVKAHIDMHHNVIDITFTVYYIEGKFHKINNLHQKRENHICLIMHPNPKSNDEAEVKKLYSSLVRQKIEKEGYTNAYVVSPHEEFNFRNCVVVSPFANNVDLNLANIIQSSLVFVEGDSRMYSRVCPICGRHVDGERDDGNCHCDDCNSVWTALISGDDHKYQNTIWLKAIKRID